MPANWGTNWGTRVDVAKVAAELAEKVTDPPPVFRGLAACGLSGLDIAACVGVAASTVSKWRTGRSVAPPESLQFLTLVLADHLESRREALGGIGGLFQPRLRGALKVPADALREQEALNALLPPMAARNGLRRFRQWYAAREVIADNAANIAGRSA